jgi:hypothetical protein
MTTEVETRPVTESDIGHAYYAKVLKNTGYSVDTLPQLDLKGRMGSTDYIDFVTPNDMTSPVMKFRDRFNRPGIAIHIVGKTPGVMVKDLYGDEKTDSSTLNNVLALFQRYSDTTGKWSYGWGRSKFAIEHVYNAYHQTHGHANDSKIMACDDCPFVNACISSDLLTQILTGTNPILTLANA